MAGRGWTQMQDSYDRSLNTPALFVGTGEATKQDLNSFEAHRKPNAHIP